LVAITLFVSNTFLGWKANRDVNRLEQEVDWLKTKNAQVVEDSGEFELNVFGKAPGSPERTIHFSRTFSIPPHVEFVHYESKTLDRVMVIAPLTSEEEEKKKYKQQFLRGLKAGEVTTTGFVLHSHQAGGVYEDARIRWRARGITFPERLGK
jgi:hypothetical protein